MTVIKRVNGKSFKEVKADYIKLKGVLPVLLANKSLNHFKKGFRQNGGQTNISKGGWKPLSKRYEKWKYRGNKKRATMVLSGDLRRDIQRRSTSFPRTVIGTTNIAYAARHNKGLKGMPKREFIGHSKELENQLKTLIDRKLKNLFR